MRYLSCLAIACAFFGFTIAFEQERIPRFTDYPARVIGGGNSFNVKTRSTPDTACFRNMLRKTARYGEHFAGHYALSYWGCGTECARIGIVDLLTGRAYVSPFAVTGVGIKTRSDSRLVLVNDPEVVGKNWGDPAPIAYQPMYFLWTGRHLLPIYEGGRIGREWEREFKRCAELRFS